MLFKHSEYLMHSFSALTLYVLVTGKT